MTDRCDISELGYYLNRAFTRLVDDLDRALRDAGIELSHSQFSILRLLSRSGSGEMSQPEMSKRLGKDPAAISRAVRYLQSQGFIERRQVSGCKNSVSLTPKAKSLQPRIEQIIRAVTTDACREMSSDQISAGLVFLMGLLKYKP